MSVNIPQHLIPSDPRFGCGPSLIRLEDLARLQQQGPHLLGTSHRKEPVKVLCREIQDNLRSYLNVPQDYSIVLGNGGATLLFDMVGLGLVKKRIVHHVCGEFSDKWFNASRRIPWIEAEKRQVENGQGNVMTQGEGADVVAVTLNETSTGVMNTLLPEVDEHCLLAVDATSGAGQVACDISRTDLFFFSPQKVFASEGGLFVALLSPKAKARIAEVAADSERYIPVFADWRLALSNSEQAQTYNTPAVVTLWLFAEQVKRMNALGFAQVEQQAKEKAEWVYQWAQTHNSLSCYVADPRARSTTVATIDVADSVDVSKLTAWLEQRQLVYGIDGYRALGRNQLRIALFHNISLDDLKKLTALIDYLIDCGEFAA
ncbi:aminotransferase class V-fold PLP-dependent enzyme [Pantoea alhagi]|uniref:aminotransferase class V-fold PLP-dependent enzyme n=1 Tax=Pantoea alhagi TaxID=1891675 RepID=UPI00202AEB8B|nr:aminotransferase class V-fold PLP-dependent enzyme [Pantoea alhagi]URQ62330.1 aminotransferase class V-fold PLP-dependent enzyme [Pantoea alhagi]